MDKAEKAKILEELGGLDEADYDSLVTDLIVQTEKQLKDLRSAISGGNFDTAMRIAHSIKGSSGNLRIKKMYEIARSMETEAKEGKDKAALSAAMDLLEAEFSALKKG